MARTARGRHGDYVGYKNKRFFIFFVGYMLLLFWLMLVGLAVFWRMMDAYEQSRPDHRMEAYLAEADSSYWRDTLLGSGVSESYVDTLELENVSFSKKMDRYTDAVPVYSIRFGNVDMFTVSLENGAELSFGYHLWEIGHMDVIGGKIFIYAPQDAVIRKGGEEIGKDCLIQENAQKLELGIFDRNRSDIVGLAKYQLNDTYDAGEIIVEDGVGNVLELSYSAGTNYYYAPLMDDYRITVPAGSLVSVNGIVLNEENAGVENREDEDFEGMEDYLSFVPGQDVYTIEGLVMPPDVVVETAKGNRLTSTTEGKSYLYEMDDEIPETLSQYVMTVFDAYIAYSGNRSGDLAANYERYKSYLVPGSEAADRAYMAQGSLKWASGRDTSLKSAVIKKYIAYSEELFTCQINFSLVSDESEDANAYLFIFVKYNGEWRVARILNKTSFLVQS